MGKKTVEIVFRKNFYEKTAWAADKVVCGIDEVGRGCLAGPVVSAAVILPPNKKHRLLKDSKTLTQKELLQGYNWIVKHCKYAIGIASSYEIDKFNIWQATLIAMKRATLNLMIQAETKPSAILVDAMPLKLMHTVYNQIPVYSFPKGETKSASIAAASIVAKVTRDRMMCKLDSVFPGYLLRTHKGYGTKKHRSAIDTQKYTIIHRVSFLNKIVIIDEYEYEEQLSFF